MQVIFLRSPKFCVLALPDVLGWALVGLSGLGLEGGLAGCRLIKGMRVVGAGGGQCPVAADHLRPTRIRNPTHLRRRPLEKTSPLLTYIPLHLPSKREVGAGTSLSRWAFRRSGRVCLSCWRRW